MANEYQNFTNPIIDSESPWQAMNKNLSGISSGALGMFLQQKQQEEAQKQAMAQLLLKGQIEQQQSIALEKAKKDAEFDMQNKQFDRAKRLQTESPGLFGQANNIPSNGNNMSQFAPQPFAMLTDPMSGKIKQVVNPEYALYRSQKLAEMKNKMQPESEAAAGAIAYSKSLKDNMDEINNIVDKKDFDWGAFGAWRVSQDNPSFTSFGRNMKQNALGEYEDPKAGDYMKIHNALQFIKKTAFGEGGKTLTDTEKALVYSVLQPQGMPINEWKKNLKKASSTLAQKAALLARNKENIDNVINSTNVDKDLDSQINSMLDQLGAE